MKEFLLVYDLLALLFCVASVSILALLWLKTRGARLPVFITLNLLTAYIVAVLAFDQFMEIVGRTGALRTSVWNSIPFCCCAISVVLTRFSRPQVPTRISRRVGQVFGAGAVTAALLLLADGSFPGNQPLFLVAYGLAFTLLTLSIVNFGFQGLRKTEPVAPGLGHFRRTLKALKTLTLVLLPVFIVVDFFGWLIPGLGSWLPRGLSILPAFLTVMSFSMVLAAALEILEPVVRQAPAEVSLLHLEKYGLTKREAEVVPLLLQFQSYKEMGESLFIAPGTVRTHVVRIYQKTGVRSRLELARLFLRATE